MDCIYVALFYPVATQSPVQYWLSPIHAHILTPMAVSAMQGDSQLIGGK